MADERAFALKIITPDRIFYEGDAIMVELRTTEGEIGVFKNHIPLTCVVAPGLLRIRESDKETKVAALISGFVEILQDSMTILAEVVEWSDEIDLARAEEAKERAEKRIMEKADDTDMRRAECALQRSIARIEAAKK
ncbi:MAG: ATP synthase F1 subunit epsilon [Lachnospiraceae bacterium]|nr:ATP synthase F1 subunit epsilon [Lachnospiraceae bacterium]